MTGDIYHVITRGTDGRNIFLDDNDRLRFMHDLFEFNDVENVNNGKYLFAKTTDKDTARPHIIARKEKTPRALLIHLYAFCAMKNHYHLMIRCDLRQKLSLYMRKLNGGYSKYFNAKYNRAGTLFQGPYKAVSIKKESHFLHLPYYIHLNPLDYIEPNWRKRKIKDFNKAVSFLESYRWSSHLDYLGEKNFPSLTQRGFLLEFFGGAAAYRKTIYKYLKELEESSWAGLEEILLE